MTPPCPMMRAGQHGFNGGKSGMVVLSPGVHDIKIDYFQVSPGSPVVLVCHRAQYQGLRGGLHSSTCMRVPRQSPPGAMRVLGWPAGLCARSML